MADTPLRFDYVPAGNIEVLPDDSSLREHSSSVLYSTRPIRVDEKIFFRFNEMTGDIKYGFFTTSEPSASPTYWSKQLVRNRFCKTDTVWYFYVNSSGDVHIARNGRDERVYYSAVNFKRPLWVIVYVGENTSLEFIEPIAGGVGPPAQRTPRQLVLTATEDATCSGAEGLRFHDFYTRHNALSKDGFMAHGRNMNNVFFSNRPVKINEMVCLSFVKVSYKSFTFGFSRRQPIIGEYIDTETSWCKHLERDLFEQNNILHFYMNSSGDVIYGINGKDVELDCLGIDTSVPLWAVIELRNLSAAKFINSVDFLSRWALEDVNEAESIGQTDNQTLLGRTNKERNEAATRQQSEDVTLNRQTRQDIPRTSQHQSGSPVVSPRSTNTAIASSSQNQSTKSSRYLSFHPIHGANIELSRDGSTVRCGQKDAIDGIAFSANSIKANEVLAFRILETHSMIGFGFTCSDPIEHTIPDTVTFLSCLPEGYWVSCLGPTFCKKDNIWYLYVNTSGDVHIGVNGRDVRVFFSAIFHQNPYWAFVEIWGDTVLQLVDSRIAKVGLPALRTPEALVQTASANSACPRFHEVHGDHVKVSNDGFILQSRSSHHERKGIAFSDRPIGINETIRILFVDVGHPLNFIAFGFTKHNPDTLTSLPDYISNEKNDIPGYWANYLEDYISVKNNILDFHVNAAGHIQYGINGTKIGIFCNGIETRNPLWVVVQIRPNNSTIKFIDHIEAEERGDIERIDEYENDVINYNDDLSLDVVQISENTDREQNRASPHQQSTNVETLTIPDNLNQLNASLTSHYEPTAPPDTECIICTEQEANTVFFSCGHICACYDCAEQLWRGTGNGTCPVCRAEIQQILRTYR